MRENIILLATLVLLFGSISSGHAQKKDSQHDVESLLMQLNNLDETVRVEACAALGETRDSRAFEPLLESAQDRSEDGQVRMSAIMALGTLGDVRAVAPLVDILEKDMKERTGIWAGAIIALGELGDPEAVPILLNALKNRDQDWLGREMAARALGNIGDSRAAETLIAATSFVDTRHDAIAALAQIGDIRALETFIEALHEGEDPETVRAAMTGILKIGKSAVPLLMQQLQNHSKEFPEKQQRIRIMRLLDEIGDSSTGEVPGVN